jgi:hypothetical protein
MYAWCSGPMTYSGVSWPMVRSPPNQLIECSPIDHSRTLTGNSSGRQRRRTTVKILPGCSCKTGYGWLTESSSSAVRRTRSVSYAELAPSLLSTWSLLAPTLCGYGGAWNRGWASPSDRYWVCHTGGYGLGGMP